MENLCIGGTYTDIHKLEEPYIGEFVYWRNMHRHINWRNHILENLCIGGTYTEIHKLEEPYIGEFVYWRNIHRHT